MPQALYERRFPVQSVNADHNRHRRPDQEKGILLKGLLQEHIICFPRGTRGTIRLAGVSEWTPESTRPTLRAGGRDRRKWPIASTMNVGCEAAQVVEGGAHRKASGSTPIDLFRNPVAPTCGSKDRC